jgi:hypothetical protein
MKLIILLLLLCCSCKTGSHQFRLDNIEPQGARR